MKQIFYLIFTSLILLPQKVFAANTTKTVDGINLPNSSDLNASKWGDLAELLKAVPNILIGLAGAVFLFTLLFGGYIYLTATGDQQKEELSKKVFLYGVIGFIIILGSYGIVIYFMKTLGVQY